MKKEIIKKSILQGKFETAYEFSKYFSPDEFEDLLLGVAYDTQSITVYAFVCYLIELNDCIEYHNIAQTLMANPLCFIEGAYVTALYHNRSILKMNSENINAKLMLLFYNTLPDKLVSDAEAVIAAKEILVKEPENKTALNYILKYDKQ